MALTFGRWVSVAAILCGLAVIAILREPRAQQRNDVSSDFQRRENLAGTHVSVAAERLQLLTVADSVKRALGTGGPAESRVFYGAGLSPQARRVFEMLIGNVATSRPSRPQVPVDLVFLLDTTHSIRGAPRLGYSGLMRADYLLPRPNSSNRCVVIARVKEHASPTTQRTYAPLLGDATRARLLGPCGFYEWFGTPGPQVDRWLKKRGWELGLASAFEAAYPRWQPRWWWSRSEWGGLFSDWALREATTPRGFACAAASTAACDTAVLDGPGPGALRSAKVWSADIVSPRTGLDVFDRYWWWRNAEELGPREWTILAEMARTLGPERFGKVWRSNQPLREAFRSEAGMELGDWTREWSQRLYGDQGRGPGISALSALMAMSIAAAAFGVALATVRRRRVA